LPGNRLPIPLPVGEQPYHDLLPALFLCVLFGLFLNSVPERSSFRIRFEIARRLSENRGVIRKWILQAPICSPRTTIPPPARNSLLCVSLFYVSTKLLSTWSAANTSASTAM